MNNVILKQLLNKYEQTHCLQNIKDLDERKKKFILKILVLKK